MNGQGFPHFPRIPSPDERMRQETERMKQEHMIKYPEIFVNMSIKLAEIQSAKDAIQMQAGRLSPNAINIAMNYLNSQEEMLIYHLNSMATNLSS